MLTKCFHNSNKGSTNKSITTSNVNVTTTVAKYQCFMITTQLIARISVIDNAGHLTLYHRLYLFPVSMNHNFRLV